MKFLADENIAGSTIQMLKDSGYDIKDHRELKLTSQKDEIVIKKAKDQKRIIITLDKDFCNIIRHPLESHFGIILIAVKCPTPNRVNFYLKKLFNKINKEKFKKSLVIVKENGFKILSAIK